jgi:hypothetical protein
MMIFSMTVSIHPDKDGVSLLTVFAGLKGMSPGDRMGL